MNVSVAIRDNQVLAYLRALEGDERGTFLAAMADGVKEQTQRHLLALSLTRHASAQRLGATPTKHLGEAAKAVEEAPIAVEGEAASFTINHPGLGRAFHDVTILPSKEFITIPLNALAYGHRAGEFQKVLLLGGGRGGSSATTEKKKTERKPIPQDIPVYALVRSVFQPQDRTLLPSAEEWTAAATAAGAAFLQKQAT